MFKPAAGFLFLCRKKPKKKKKRHAETDRDQVEVEHVVTPTKTPQRHQSVSNQLVAGINLDEKEKFIS